MASLRRQRPQKKFRLALHEPDLYVKVRRMRNRALSYGLTFVLAGVLVGACATKEVRDGFGDGDEAADAGPGNGSIINPDAQGIGSDNGGVKAEVSGTTYAPNGDLPLSGVLVYWTKTEPEAIPSGVYCDECVELAEGTSAISGADGKFTLKIPANDDSVYVVTQKGQFRRVRKVNLAEDATKLDKELTTLPGKTDEADGDTIPKIALMTEPTSTTFDMIQTALEGLGIEEWDNLEGDRNVIKNDLDQYQIAMFPCGSGEPADDEEKDALRAFVEKGGKIYASDYSHEYADAVFPEYFTSPMTQDGTSTAPDGSFLDDGLSNWLTAIGDDPQDATFEGVWSSFHGIQAAEVPAPDGTLKTFEPKVWTRVTDEADYGSGEASISFPYGCGRGMASIFHVHGTDSSNLLEQEKALLYMLLEVSACVKKGGDVN